MTTLRPQIVLRSIGKDRWVKDKKDGGIVDGYECMNSRWAVKFDVVEGKMVFKIYNSYGCKSVYRLDLDKYLE